MEMRTQEEQGGINVAWEKWGKQTEGSRQTFTPKSTKEVKAGAGVETMEGCCYSRLAQSAFFYTPEPPARG